MHSPTIVSREEWLQARKAHLVREKELTRMRDEIARERRALPWVRVEKTYVFDTPSGPAGLSDLFDRRSQLAIYHFMLSPGDDHICDGCAFISDHVDCARQHFEQADLSFAAVSRAPLAQILPVKRRMGWSFRWVSSHGTDFNYDYGVSFTPEQVAAGRPLYNFGTTPYLAEDLHGLSIFAKGASGQVFHTYSAYARGAETLLGAFNFLDFTPKGRNEKSIMDWVRLHDEYRAADAELACPSCGAENRAAGRSEDHAERAAV
jgi:predicted dithiol-disulfide oxidoreductase (DUF899 family)